MAASGPNEAERSLLVNSSRIYLAKINEEYAKQMSTGSLMLDVGAGSAPYKRLFSHVQYESVDFHKVAKKYANSTYVADICEGIPVENGRFKYILCTQVLEHLKEPGKALSELNRVLAPGGMLLCTVPLFYEEHEVPYDFYRYTQFAHRHMFPAAGFQIEKIEWLEGFFGTCGYMLQTMYKYVPATVEGTSNDAWWARAFLTGFRPVALAAAGAFYKMDLIWKITNVGFPKNYVIWAKKPSL